MNSFTHEPSRDQGSLRSPSRRDVLTAIGAVGASALFPSGKLFSQPEDGDFRRIDVHHHFASPRWIVKETAARKPGYEDMQKYTPARDIESMDQNGIQKAFVSCTERGVWFGDDFEKERTDAIALARDMNEFGAKMMSDYKGRFGLFAVLPLPDVDASLREIEYAFDTLKANGVGLMTSYGNLWLGDKKLQPVFDELNRRRTVVYTHPTDPPCCHNLLPDTGPGAVEWLTDTARTIFSLINDGSPAAPRTSMATRYGNIDFIWAHSGGSLLGFVGRFLGNPTKSVSIDTPAPQDSRLYHLRRFYYDTASSANPVQMKGMKEFVGTSHILFGTDFPYWPPQRMVEQLQICGFSPAELRAIERENALKIPALS